MTTNPDVPAGAAGIPAAELPDETLQPETQGSDPVEADLGGNGQGDLAPEDLAGAGGSAEASP
jgi:hypothetical protein